MTAEVLPGLVTLDGQAVAALEGEASTQAAAAHARVIGIDPSLVATGMSDGRETWVVPSRGKKDDTLTQRWVRLRTLGRAVCERVPADTQLVLIEGPAFGSRDGHAHDRSGLWWLVVNSLRVAGLPVVEIAPTVVKKYATGKGNGAKEAVIYATAQRFPDVDIGSSTDRADALWLAAIGIDHLTGAHVVPATHRTVLDRIHWPDGRQP